ncbi:HET-domain-containing protein [Apiospora saccharicola]|uniref:HET-domain-containing protein n=1 Tax=Apiospora saccharicola TaxID=335842 RepID=A0ABR1VNS9_9PEZI
MFGRTLQQWARRLTWTSDLLLSRFHTAPRLHMDPHDYKSRTLIPGIFHFVEHGMRLMSTSIGYIGWAHERARVHDSIFILKGSTVPVILRPRQEGGYVLVGDAFVTGIMAGEAMKPASDPSWIDVQIH